MRASTGRRGADSWGEWLLGWLFACLVAGLSACDDPQTGTPGLDPPKERLDGGLPGSAAGSGGPLNTAGMSHMSAGSGGGAPHAGSGDVGAFDAGASEDPEAGADGGDRDQDGGADDAGLEDAGPGAELFEGLWVVDQPAHALYEATQYELLPGGGLREGDTIGAPTEDFVTGTVGKGDPAITCRFARSWRTLAARTLELDSDCTDGTPRTVVLAFPEGDESAGLDPQVESVAGETGWGHLGFLWAWRKCAIDSDCPPF